MDSKVTLSTGKDLLGWVHNLLSHKQTSYSTPFLSSLLADSSKTWLLKKFRTFFQFLPQLIFCPFIPNPLLQDKVYDVINPFSLTLQINLLASLLESFCIFSNDKTFDICMSSTVTTEVTSRTISDGLSMRCLVSSFIYFHLNRVI